MPVQGGGTMEAMGNLVVRALAAVAVVALGIAVYSLVVNLGLQSEIGGLKQEVVRLQAELEGTQGTVDTVRGDLGAISSGVIEQNARLDDLLSRIRDLETLTSPLDQVLTFLRSTFPDLDI
jgi:hypothetical protein